MSRLFKRVFPVALTCSLMLSSVQPVMASVSPSNVAVSTAPVASTPTTSTTPPTTTTSTTSTTPSSPTGVFRVQDRPSPYGPDYYKVLMGHLYHIWGTPNLATASIDLGPAPSFFAQGNVYVKDKDLFYLRDTNEDRLVGTYIPPYQVLDLRTASHVTAQDIDDYIRQANPSSPLVGLGAAFLEAQTKYGVNAHYLVAHAILESNWGMSDIARDKHNLFGFRAYDDSPYNSAAYFPGFKDSILYVAYYVRVNYLDTTGRYFLSSNLKGMNAHYASDPDWAEKIASRMQKIRAYQDGEYDKAPVLAMTAAPPPAPVIVPPVDPTPTDPGSTPTSPNPPSRGTDPTSTPDSTGSYPPGTLGRVATDVLNFRAEPSTQATKLKALSRGTPLVLVKKNAEGWYQAKTGEQTGWVFGSYVDTDETPSELPENIEVAKDKTWTVKFNRSLSPGTAPDVLQSYVSVVNVQGGFVPIQVMPGSSPDVLLVKPPAGGYLPGGEYYLYISKGLTPKSGAALPHSVRMRFTVKA